MEPDASAYFAGGYEGRGEASVPMGFVKVGVVDARRFSYRMSCMKMLASRQLAAAPGKVWKSLAEEGVLVVTKDGRPRGIITPTSDQTLLEDLQDLVYARARRAVSAIRAEARRGRPWTEAELEQEIAAARRR